jgi:hypothetical protein
MKSNSSFKERGADVVISAAGFVQTSEKDRTHYRKSSDEGNGSQPKVKNDIRGAPTHRPKLATQKKNNDRHTERAMQHPTENTQQN